MTEARGAQRCVAAYLVGPTAVGKTAVGIHVARALGAEILSIDSRQIYRGLDIGTAKPTPAECAQVPHHLIDLCEPSARMSAAQFARHFAAACSDLARRGRRGLAVGGAGLYVDACLGRLDPLPPADPAVRARHARIAAEEGSAALHARLRRLDPASAGRLAPADLQRVSRALEVCELTGRRLSELQLQRGAWDVTTGPPMIVLARPRAELDARIETRARAMVAAGLLAEVERLVAAGVAPDCPACESIGYAEFAQVLSGERALEEALAAFVLRTRRYAKRQVTWFRNRYRGAVDLLIEPQETPEQTAQRALAVIARSPGITAGGAGWGPLPAGPG